MSMTEEQAARFLTIEKAILKRVTVTETILLVICILTGLALIGVVIIAI